LTRKDKCEKIVDLLLQLAEAGRTIEFSEHMREVVISYGKNHQHVEYFNGDKGKIGSILGILRGMQYEVEE